MLIPPSAVERIEPTTRRLVTGLSRKQVEDSPGLDSARPVVDPDVVLDRAYEARYHESFGRSGYWERRPESWKRYAPAA